MEEFLAFKVSATKLFAVTAGGEVFEFDGDFWKKAELTPLLKKWVEVEVEWQEGK